MKRQEIIQNELMDWGLKHLASISKTTPFVVPTNYFNDVPHSVQQRIDAQETGDAIIGFAPKMPFSDPPESYFEGLAQQVLATIKSESAQEWPKQNPYSIPQGYFEVLPQNILTAIQGSEHSKKPIVNRIPLHRTVQWAASIALLFFVALGVFKMKEQKASDRLFDTVTQAEIAAYVNSNIDDFDTDLVLNGLAFHQQIPEEKSTDAISNEEIKDYLSEDGLN